MKNVVIIILSLFLFSNSVLCHDQDTHKYMTVKAYDVLKKFVGSIPIMENHLGSTSSYYNGEYAFQRGYITTGAYREDEEDIVYGYDGYLLSGLGLDFDDWAVSLTHFWDADNGDNSLNNIYATTIPLHKHTQLGDFPNAYTKFQKYAYSNKYFQIKYKMTPGIAEFKRTSGSYIYITHCGGVGFKYNSLVELYKTGKAYLTGYYSCPNADWQSCNYEIILGQGYRDALVWEILGRMCHLLEDMSVPAHANVDEHGYYKDTYEDYMGNSINYTLSNNEFNSIKFINPCNYQNSDPLHFLMYVTSQISDHFASDGEDQNGYSDNILGGNGTSAERNYINTNFPLATLGPPINRNDAENGTWNSNIRSKTYFNAIGMTSGLLYWFAKECNLLPPPSQPLAVSISGPSNLSIGQTGTWTANASGGKSPYSYSWQYYKECTNIASYSIEPNSVPCGLWFDFGSNSITASRSDSYDFRIKVTVTDANNKSVNSSMNIIVGLNKINLADENQDDYETEELPTEYKLSQNYPNPFNPSTKIVYDIPKNNNVSLKVYNSLGKEVNELVNGFKQAGSYSVTFDASNLPSGVYFYKIQAGEYNQVNKMILLK